MTRSESFFNYRAHPENPPAPSEGWVTKWFSPHREDLALQLIRTSGFLPAADQFRLARSRAAVALFSRGNPNKLSLILLQRSRLLH